MLRVFVGHGDAWQLLRRAARLVWGMEELPEVVRERGRKPQFVSDGTHHFNLSHSGDFAMCALSDYPVGADIEVLRPHRSGLPEYVFKDTEYDRYLALGGDWPAFFVLWTEKESIIKYTGEGLKAWRRAQVPPGCAVTNLSGDGWWGAVCGHEPVSTVEYL